ncbi:MAG TPA: hypothetical protein VJR02_22770 [Pyrinomonadaceae bacterium]|nr:hypothetical protein [Pyrinomonadaceae bacterium]
MKRIVLLIIAACVFSVFHAAVVSVSANCLQAGPSASPREGTPPDGVTTSQSSASGDVPVVPGEISVGNRYLSSKEFLLAILVTAMLFITLLLQFALLRKIQRLKPEDTLRSFGLTLVIVGTVFFIVAGFDSEQIAPAIGLFGTIAGYMLGKTERRGNGQNE